MFFSFGTVKFIDTLNHVATSLAKFPKLVGLHKTLPNLVKTHFPHDFNTDENMGYKGPLPAIEHYGVEFTSEDPVAFAAWHETERQRYTPFTEVLWDMTAIEIEYCHRDTEVLALCAGAYRQQYIENMGIDPFTCVTTAGVCMKTYRSNFIPEEGIPTLSEYEAAFARRALNGGRTEAFTEYFEGEIEVLDVVSLYPSVMFDDDMPYGTPEIFKGDAVPADYLELCGFGEFDIAPPPFDPANPGFKPVIGGRQEGGKYEFSLYPMTNKVITLVEARACIKHGYTISKVYEVHSYEPRKDLLKEYICRFLKLKVESSAPPADPDTFCREYKERFGIELDRGVLMQPENPAARYLAKLCLNNLWGKFGQRTMEINKLCDPQQFHDLMQRHTAGDIEVTGVSINPHLDDAYGVKYRELTNVVDITRCKTNVAIAAHVPAGGRLVLYELLGDPAIKPIYCDTDSVYFAIPKEYHPDGTLKDPRSYRHPLEGSYLGEFEKENPPGVNYNEMVILGPKVYAVRDNTLPDTHPLKTKVRCKGFRSSNAAKELINFDSLRNAQSPDADGVYPAITVRYKHFQRQQYGSIFVGDMDKSLTYNPTTQKSLVQGPDEPWIPFGPHCDRLDHVPNVIPPKPPTLKRPPVHYDVRHTLQVKGLGAPPEGLVGYGYSDDEEEEAELSERASDTLMAQTIAAQDRRRAEEFARQIGPIQEELDYTDEEEL
jgi:hypothetical protein